MKTHKDLDIWKDGIELTKKVYKLTKQFPAEELYGLVSQMRRAAVSYPSNIAEGAARSSKSEYLRFIYISLGSLSELETQILLSKELGFVQNTDNLLSDLEKIRKMTLNFIKYLKASKL